ncbi:MAG: hypothetical protein ACE5QF_01795 [Thermoplasmata archaeon]
MTGGPSITYGYYVVFIDPDGRSIDSLGNLLFNVGPNSVTRVGETNTFVVEFESPRYAVDLTMKVSAVSADNSLNPLGDGWNYTTKEVGVEYPVSSEFPGLDISSSIYLIGTSILSLGLLFWLTIFFVDRKIKKEVVYTGREAEEGNE